MLLLFFEDILYIFTGFAIDRSKKYMKTIKIDMKIDAVDPQAAADNPPQPREQCRFAHTKEELNAALKDLAAVTRTPHYLTGF